MIYNKELFIKGGNMQKDEKLESDIKEKLKKIVNKKRYDHSILVANEAKKLAKIYSEDEYMAYLVGLAHDIAKDFSKEENTKWIEKYNCDRRILNKENEKIIHSYVGALVAKEWFNFDDNMCSAIKYHTIGNEKMSKFDKIIFISDKIGRENLSSDFEKLKEIAYHNLDEAMLFYLNLLEEKLKKQGLKLNQDSIKLRKSLSSFSNKPYTSIGG